MLRSRISVMIAMGLCTVGLSASHVEADSRPSRSVKVEFTAVSTPPSIGAIQCSASGRCIATYTVDSTYSGDLEATNLTTGTLTVDQTTGAFEGTSYQLIEGTIEGCGTGSFIVRLPLFAGGPSEPTVARGDIVAGSGTDDLVGLSGRYWVTFTTQDDGSGASSGRMKVRCSQSSH